MTHHPLTSVGIDVGSATSQVVLSRLWLGRSPGQLVGTRLDVVRREVLHASPVRPTRFTGTGVDGDALRVLVRDAYRAAGVDAADVETGAVIVTGEAARKHNAAAVAEAMAGLAGGFVCVAAGPRLEARLAALGSGAVTEEPGTRLHVDIGGATTKLAVITAGEIVATAAANVGARMLTHDAGRITSVSPALRRLCPDLAAGTPATPEVRRRVAAELAAGLRGFVDGVAGPLDEEPDEPVTAPLDHPGPFDTLSFSGGVAGYVYGDLAAEFGDVGPELGAAVRRALRASGGSVVRVPGAIRATVLGAGQFSTRVSGMTTHVGPGVLPLRGLRVARLTVPDGDLTVADVTWRTERAYRDVDLAPGEAGSLLAVRWRGDPSFDRLRTVATGLSIAAPGLRAVAVDRDLAGTLGSLLGMLELVCVDEIGLTELDVVDIGGPVSQPPVLPLVVRSVLADATVFSTQ